MATWILRSTGGDFTDEGRENFISSGRAKAADFTRADLHMPTAARGLGGLAKASRYRDLRTGGEVSYEGCQERLSNGAKASNFEPLDGDGANAARSPPAPPVLSALATRVAGLDFSEAPAPAVAASTAAQFTDKRSGAVVSAAAMQNLIAQGRAAAGDFRPA